MKLPVKCPKLCNGGTANRQVQFPVNNALNIPDPDLAQLRGRPEKIMRCSYCGCVYADGTPPKVLGWYGNGISPGRDWEPASA